ncbi:neuropeptide SIFamide receptor-like [Penaeus indicus]|uniref:neuropeptide SIFamide receptor-like n=1 Tax=Penaeus indicus TaxID=29960 RepID=UPI00300D9BE3
MGRLMKCLLFALNLRGNRDQQHSHCLAQLSKLIISAVNINSIGSCHQVYLSFVIALWTNFDHGNLMIEVDKGVGAEASGPDQLTGQLTRTGVGVEASGPDQLTGQLTRTAWVLGLFICKAVTYLQGVSVSASINTLVAISVDRALAICYPMKCQITSRTCRSIIVVIWAFSLTITLPWAIFFTLHPIPDTDIMVCTENWPDKQSEGLYFVLANLVMCYLLPLTVISICYILIWMKVWRRKLPGERQDVGVAMMMQRCKIKVIKMLLVVVILFALSWLPLYVIFARLKLGSEPSLTEERIIHVLAPFAQWLGASNSCINPMLYAFFNDKFRAGFKAILVSRACCSPLRLDTHCKSFTSSKAQQNLCSTESKATSEFSLYSSSSGSGEPRRKSIMVQVKITENVLSKVKKYGIHFEVNSQATAVESWTRGMFQHAHRRVQVKPLYNNCNPDYITLHRLTSRESW